MPLGIKGFQKGRAKTGGRRIGKRNLPKVRKTIVLEERALPEKERHRQRLIQEEKEREERVRREMEAAAAAAPAPTSPGPEISVPARAAHHHGLHETPLETWQRERRQAARSENLSAGQIANMLEGLTPNGYDRQGRKVSFVESDKPFRGSGRGLSGY